MVNAKTYIITLFLVVIVVVNILLLTLYLNAIWRQNESTKLTMTCILAAPDISLLNINTSVSFRVANRVHAPDGVFFLGLIVGYTVIYSCIYEVAKNLNIVLTRGEDSIIVPRLPDV